MWDRSRLNKLDIFQMPWEVPDIPADADGETRRFAEMQASFHERSKAYMAGGRGWWSYGDRSKIIWLYDKKSLWESRDLRSEQRRYKSVESLSEARDFLASLTHLSFARKDSLLK